MNTQLEELIAKYMEGILKEDEKQLLASMLKIPENQLYLASKIDKQFFDQSLNEIDDDEIGKQIFQSIQQKLYDHSGEQIQLQTTPQVVQMAWYRKKSVRLAVAVAASIILVISLGILFTNEKPDGRTIAVENKKEQIDNTLTVVHREVNTTGKEKRIQLPEGSLIVLADNSEISYLEPFTNKRDITLKGKAYFKVAKDKTRPFTVFSDDISTTALGTEFTVTAFEKTSQIIIRLYEGKVVVKPVGKKVGKLKNDVYLLPGQEFIYSDKTSGKVRAFKLTDATPEDVLNKEFSRDDPSIPQNTEGSWYMFNNQSLDQVFDQLSDMFNVRIVYNKKDIENIYFTSKYNKSDSLEDILKEIATIHNLTITRKDGAFIISR